MHEADSPVVCLPVVLSSSCLASCRASYSVRAPVTGIVFGEECVVVVVFRDMCSSFCNVAESYAVYLCACSSFVDFAESVAVF